MREDVEFVGHVAAVRSPARLVKRKDAVAVSSPPGRGMVVRADLEQVFRSAYPRVVAVAARVLGSRDQAEDVAQEVFLTFGRSSVPATEALGWLTVAAAHTALNHLRSGRRRASREEAAGGGDGRPWPAVGPVSAPSLESPAVWCSGLRKRYRRQVAVDDVSFTVQRGEVLGLLGPNGAGKTSAIKFLLGLVRPDAGEVLLLGRPGRDPASRARVGYLPELFRYQPWLTVAEVLALHVRLAGAAVPDRERRECLATVGLADRAGDRVGGFSKGMQQRLGLAVALVARPELVILDEPTSALDPLGRADVRDLLLALKDRKVAVLLNSHLIGEVERVCDRVVILDKGRVAAAGTLAELLGGRELRLRLDGVSDAAAARLAATGALTRSGSVFTVALPAEPDADLVPALIADLVALGVRVHAVEPARVTLEERLLDILRTGAAA
ncbi:ATP-binding cassette domain-containing protein [Dactylosporangium sp. NBC_01737]|uniref:ATP-binding cassette domain-containing protein n=1 Tax=Dactylosporangium sp. NBC_01737 TaxID=2975959 RepID=UPI002E11F93B|nr:ATP-binding cassette domain-containing protein [Dactylosporangium sp. NBC_01737]